MFKAGSVASQIDGGTIHQAIILESGSLETFALFLTTNPNWCRCSRRITKEEAALVGFYGQIAKTYLAPVIRSTCDFVVENDCTFPEHRVVALKKEFPRYQADNS